MHFFNDAILTGEIISPVEDLVLNYGTGGMKYIWKLRNFEEIVIQKISLKIRIYALFKK